MRTYSIAILGAAGLVGRQTLERLEERRFPVGKLKLLATSRSAGAKIQAFGQEIEVEETSPEAFDGVDLAFFAASTQASKELAPQAVRRGAVVIDKSNAFRMDPAVPLLVPEVNPQAARRHQGILASPNCSTIQMVMVLKPLHEAFRAKRVIVSTYQAVSGTGREAMEELKEQTARVLKGEAIKPEVYPYQIAFNVLPHIDAFDEVGYTGEEMKMVNETRKILEDDTMRISATTVRVPVHIGHSEAITIDFEREVTPEAARGLLSQTPGVVVLDDPRSLRYPMPVEAAGRDDVYVGRIRRDLSSDNGLNLWVVADNLRKGAATNAVQMAELLIREGLLLRK